jgi:hypothetical protein
MILREETSYKRELDNRNGRNYKLLCIAEFEITENLVAQMAETRNQFAQQSSK